MARSLALVVAVVLSFAAPALAVPGDEVQQPLSPANGATLPAGQPVTLTFTCPPYRQSPSADAPSDGIVGYGVTVGGDPAFTDVYGADVTAGPAPGQCTAVPKQKGGGGPLTQPGTYFWRVDRFCFCAGTDTESSTVSSFTIATPQAAMTLKAASRPYGGFPFYVDLASDLPDSTVVRVQRQRGTGWADVPSQGPIRTSKGAARAPVSVPAGTARLRWIVAEGAQMGQASSPVAVEARKAKGWSTSRRDVGRYEEGGKANTTFRVADKGRTIRDFRASVSTFCIGGLDPATNRVVSSLALVKRIRVAPDGRFLAVTTVSKTDIVVSGRLRKGKVSGGRVSVAYPLCSGARDFTAKRR